MPHKTKADRQREAKERQEVSKIRTPAEKLLYSIFGEWYYDELLDHDNDLLESYLNGYRPMP